MSESKCRALMCIPQEKKDYTISLCSPYGNYPQLDVMAVLRAMFVELFTRLNEIKKG